MVRFPDNRVPLNGHGETMAVSHDDAADAAIDRYMVAREKRRELVGNVKFGVALLAAGFLIWGVFRVAWAIDGHAAMIGVKVRPLTPNQKDE